MNDILSQIIAYSPNKIDTETKARAMVQGSRNMKLAEVPRSEMDNFNTPDLEQAPDSYLRPGETLEDFDVEFRRPNAQGGRIPFAKAPGSVKTKVEGLSKKEKIAQGLEKGRVSTNIDTYTEIVGEYNKAIQKALDTNDASKLPKPFAQILKEKGLKDGTYHSLKNNKQIPMARDVSTNRFKLANQVINEYNAQPKFIEKEALLKKANFTPKEIKVLSVQTVKEYPYRLNIADKASDKVKKAFSNLFQNPESLKTSYNNFYNPRELLANITGLDEGTISKVNLKDVDPENYEVYKRLGNSDIKNILEGDVTKGFFGSTLEDLKKYINEDIAKGKKPFIEYMDANQEKYRVKRKTRLDKATTLAGKGVADINAAQKDVVKLLNDHYKKNPEELLGNTKLRNLLDLTLEDGEIVKKNKYVTDDDFLKLIKDKKGLFTMDHVDEVQFEKLSTEFPIFKQLATYNTNSGLIKSMKAYMSKNQNSKDPAVQNKIKKQVEFLEDLKLRVDTPTGRVGSKEVLAAVDRKAGVLPNFLAQLRALNIKLPAKAKAAVLGISGGLGATTLAKAGPIAETGSTAMDTAKTVGAATAGAATVGTKPGRKLLGKAFRTLGTRAAAVPFAGYTIYDNLKKGENVVDATLDPIVGLELMLPNMFKENVSKITSNPTIQKLLKVGKFGRAFTPIGAGITAAGLGIDAYKYGKERKQLLDSLTDEQKTELFRQEQSDVVKQQLRGDENAFDEFSAARGGIASLNVKK